MKTLTPTPDGPDDHLTDGQKMAYEFSAFDEVEEVFVTFPSERFVMTDHCDEAIERATELLTEALEDMFRDARVAVDDDSVCSTPFIEISHNELDPDDYDKGEMAELRSERRREKSEARKQVKRLVTKVLKLVAPEFPNRDDNDEEEESSGNDVYRERSGSGMTLTSSTG